ncbi:MAG: DNA polymerase III subunit gamma/tau [Candidatus Acidiferrales bacterium]
MGYQVIARKWRPQGFSSVVGQEHVTQTLENAIRTGRVAHAYIFAGVRGVGKTTTARILAKALNCTKSSAAGPCNECDSCREIAAGTSLDVLEIDAASNRGIDQIRELREMVRYAAAGGHYKIVILDEAHQLTDEASNALLKTLEEPPDRVIFIMATTQPEDLVDTIKSRAQLFQFRSLSFTEISRELERIAAAEKLKIDPGAVAVLARAGEGSMRDALSLLEQAMAYCGEEIRDDQVRQLLGVVGEEVLDSLVEAIDKQSAEKALELVHRLIADGHNLNHFCREAIRHFRNLLVARVCGADSDLVAAPADERSRIRDQAARFTEEDLTRHFEILLRTDDEIRHRPDARLHLEIGLLRMVNAGRLAPLEEVIAELRGDGARLKTQTTAARASIESATAPASARGTDIAGEKSARAENRIEAPSAVALAPVRHIVARSTETMTAGLAAAQMDAIRAALQSQKFLWSMLENATRWEFESGEVRLYFPAESRALAEMLQSRDPMEKLRNTLSQVLGQPLRVCVKMEAGMTGMVGSAELRARMEEDPIVREMLKRFGGQIAEVRRRSED